MFKRSLSLFLLLGAMMVVSIPSADARKDRLPCTQEDMELITKFDKKAKYKVKLMKEYTEKIGKAKKESRYASKIQKLWEFFDSDEFNEMEERYKRCDKKIPRPQVTPVQFWMPDNLRERR